MNDEPVYAVNLAIGLALLLSLLTLFQLFQRHIAGQPLLAYEPRRPVPWNLLPALVMLAPLILSWWSAITGETDADPSTEIYVAARAHVAASIGAPPACVLATAAMHANLPYILQPKSEPGALTFALWLQSLTSISLAAIAYLLLAAVFGADWRDLGLPRDRRQFIYDMKIGAAACVASLAPIYGMLLILNELFKPKQGHPLIHELMVDHSLGMMIAAGFAAVVAAPIYEETAFRLVFQGWLERREMLAQPVIAHQVMPPSGAASQLADLAVEGEQVDSTPEITYTYAPPGWASIGITSVFFGLAHYGHGVSPIPLILLGAVMGYLYQRTHRVTPSIVCHLLFNLFTFVLLALQFAAI